MEGKKKKEEEEEEEREKVTSRSTEELVLKNSYVPTLCYKKNINFF